MVLQVGGFDSRPPHKKQAYCDKGRVPHPLADNGRGDNGNKSVTMGKDADNISMSSRSIRHSRQPCKVLAEITNLSFFLCGAGGMV